MSSQTFFVLPLTLAVVGILLQASFIFSEYKKRYVPSVILKGSASLMFVLVGLVGLSSINLTGYINKVDLSSSSDFAKLILIGLIFGMLGDIFLNLRFIFTKSGQKIFLVGIFFFLVGHIIYLAALIPNAVNLALCIFIGAGLAAALLAFIFCTMKVKPAFKIFGVVYLGAIIIMTVTAIGIALAVPDTHNLVFAIGALLFMASDIILIFNTFGSNSRFSMRILNLSLYYIGQLLIAGSLFF